MVYTFQIPEPAHVHGYTGHVAGMDNKYGRSYAQTTHDALVDPETPGSGRTVLTDYTKEGYDTQEFKDKYKQVAYREASWGDQKYKENQVPGYTGFVPRLQNHPGKHYTEACVRAISEFMDEQAYHRNKFKELDEQMKQQTPLKQVQADMDMYDSPQTKTKHWRRPFDMENNESMKFQISGYAGHVPCTRELHGMNYPVTTHVGLNKFHDRIHEHDALRGKEVDLNKPDVVTVHTRKIYRENEGMLNGYTGFIPGHHFSVGQCIGQSTRGAHARVPILVEQPDPNEKKVCGEWKIRVPVDDDAPEADEAEQKKNEATQKVVGKEGVVRVEPKIRKWQKGDDPYCIVRKATDKGKKMWEHQFEKKYEKKA